MPSVRQTRVTSLPARRRSRIVALVATAALVISLPITVPSVVAAQPLATAATAHTVAPLTPSEERALAGSSLREALTREQFYFVMTDRFANGSSANDPGGLTGDRLATGLDPTHKGFYHGGDLVGLRGQLDYLEGLGTTAIWLTPSFKNKPVQGPPGQETAAYHGYWITDFTQIDPHLGTNDELSALIDDAHGRGMKVFFDIITNHTADVITYEEGIFDYITKTEQPYIDASGAPFDDLDYAAGNTFPSLDPETSFPYTPAVPDAEAEVKVPAWLNNPIYYHNRGNAAFDGTEGDVYGDFVGLDDLFTAHPDVRNGMIDIYKSWAEFGVDGFRIDTVKHVNLEFWQAFGPAIQAAAAADGNDDFFMFGEVFDANPAFLSTFSTEARLQSTLDFGFQSAATGFAKGNETTRLRDLFAKDDYYTDTDSNVYQTPTFLGNHDMGRIGKFLLDGGYAGDELLDRDELAHSLMYLTRGQPVVYYGDEQGFVGDGGDQDARQDMFASQVSTYNDDVLIGSPETTAVDNYDTDDAMYTHIAALSDLRTKNPTLADGAQIHRFASNSPGIYAFSRIDARDQVEYIVAANNSTSAATASFDTFSENGRFRGLWPDRSQLRSDREGRVTVTVPPLSVQVWKAAAKIKRTTAAPEPTLLAPAAGSVVGGRAEIRAAVPGGGFNQVTFAYRLAGDTTWTPLGTDDNAPYRVFHDVTDLETGAIVEYAAVVKDSSGRLASTVDYGTVGDPPPPPPPTDWPPVTQPEAVSVPGTFNSEVGCPGDWLPDCEEIQLTHQEPEPGELAKRFWQGTLSIPAGDHEYKVAIDRAWDENYGAGGAPGGGNVPLTVGAEPVTFYYDHRTHYFTNTTEELVVVPGSFQDELGCPGDWQPDCVESMLMDADGDGTYTFTTGDIPPGSYEAKVAHNLSWDENYGAGGAPDGPNIAFTVGAGDLVTFSYNIVNHVLTITTAGGGGGADLSSSRAHWLAQGVVAWNVPDAARNWTFRLHYDREGDLAVDAETIGGSSIPLTLDPAGLSTALKAKWPHLAAYDALRLSDRDARDERLLRAILQGQVAIAAYDDAGRLVDATGVQIAGVLDDLYSGATERRLGPWFVFGRPVFSLWAPTAQDVALWVDPPGDAPRERYAMSRDIDGIWTRWGRPGWTGGTYTFEITVYAPSTGQVETNAVTDPYSVALTTNSTASVIADLTSTRLTPANWYDLRKPDLEQPEDSTIYELHVRDFSIGDETVPTARKGTYLAFVNGKTDGMHHLSQLAAAGLNTVHLLPAFDIATIEEDGDAQATPDCDLPAMAPDSEEQQACIGLIRDEDGFNWGYDPLHYTAPEGSYATDPEGALRTREFRRMVAGLNRIGLRVVMDVVYNHTAAAGQAENSVLDRIVPGYYQRLNATGGVENSTCCANTATEHAMMEKLMIDSIVTWAKQYKVDGFRFDLMGHHSKQNLLNVRAALDALTLRRDGVDGKKIFLYGEGWNFGEVADNARFEQATQANMGGTGIATFSDRLRDAVRGGGPFDEDPRIQGYGTGLTTAPNGSQANGTPDEQRARMLRYHDLIKVGLTGNLRDFRFLDQTGTPATGADIDYNGSPAGYTQDPSEVITYVDAHDNETLFDASVFKLPATTTPADRVRWNTISLATTALSQGPVLWHAGADLLRSKSLDRNSYNSGDWFNRIDWSGKTSTFGSGLPPRADNEAKWDYMRPLLADPANRPTLAEIDAATAAAQQLLELRFSSPLFRLGDADLIQEKLRFPLAGLDQTPGVIVMVLDDAVGPDVDEDLDRIVVVFNATQSKQSVELGAIEGLELSPIQAAGADPIVAADTVVDGRSVSVPRLSVVVLQG